MLLSRLLRPRTAKRTLPPADPSPGAPAPPHLAPVPHSRTPDVRLAPADPVRGEGRHGDLDDLPSDRTTAAPAQPPRSALFPVRLRGEPGREYGALLAIPADLGPDARKARLLAVQGILHARQGRPDSARAAFALALTSDPTLDVAAMPTFWDLPRTGCQAAVSACEDAGLPREAAELQTRITYQLRPRALRLVRAADERQSS